MKLGYEKVGEGVRAPRGEPVRELEFELTDGPKGPQASNVVKL